MSRPPAGADPAAGDERPSSGSRAAVLAAARELFAERGFNQVTIRDIAARADLSPAMVMKCGGSKKQLFYEAATVTPPPLPDVSLAELGHALVRDLLDRYQRDAIEPLTRALVLRLSAPDPDAVRERFLTGYVDPLAERLGAGGDGRLTAELIVSTLCGLAANLRIFEVPHSRAALDEVAAKYGQLVQQLINQARAEDPRP